METIELVSYREEFYPRGFRKVVALLMIVAATTMPATISWQYGPAEQPGASRLPTGRYGPSGGFLPERESEPGLLSRIGTGLKHFVILLTTTFGLILYYPRGGFKRYAILCGPLLTLIVPMCLSMYRLGRNKVYRVEIVLVSLIAASPVIALYVWLTWRKAKKIGMVW